jgi:hypothetical protein
MTVSTNTRRVTYAGDGTSKVFSVPFKFLANGDLKVLLASATGAETALSLDTHYVVAGANAEAGGTLTMTIPPVSGERLLIKREVTRLQQVDYTPFDQFPAEANERALDRLTMAVQEDADNQTRAIVVPEADPYVGNLTLPPAASRSGYLLGFGASGEPTMYAPGAASNAATLPYTAPGSSRVRNVAAVMDDRVHLEDYAVLDGAATTAGVCTGTSASAGLAAAIARINARGGGKLVVDGPARLTLSQGLSSNTEVHLTSRAALLGDLPVPVGDKMHYQVAVLYGAGIELDADYVTNYGATGDYFVSPPRAFAANQVIRQGDNSFVAASAALLTDVQPGDWLHLSAAHSGWHSVVSEYVRVQSIVGALCTFTRPCRFQYDNLNNGLADFCRLFKWARNAPGGANGISRNSWPRAGFRRVAPVESIAITGEGRILNLRDRRANGVADFSVLFWAAIGCRIDASVKLRGGGMWMLDCQDMGAHASNGPAYASSSNPNDDFLFNGSNNVLSDGSNMTGCGFDIEEYAANVAVRNATVDGGIVRVQAGARRVTLDNIIAADPVGPPAVIVGSGDFELGCQDVVMNRVRALCQGNGFAAYSQSLFTAHPSIKPAMIAAVRAFYEGTQIMARDCEFASVANDGLDMLCIQPIRAENCLVGTPSTLGGVTKDGITQYNGRIIGKGLKRVGTGLRTGVAIVSALPTFMPAEVGDIAAKQDGSGEYECVNLRQTTINSQISTTVLQINNATSDGSIAVGDVAAILISNGTTVVNVAATFTAGSAVVTQTDTTGMAVGMAVSGQWTQFGAAIQTIDSPTQFTMTLTTAPTLSGTDLAARGANCTVGNITKEHIVVLTGVNTGTSEITFAGQAIPAGYSAVTAAGGYVRLGRWA